MSDYDPTLFAGAARYYAKYRPKYPQAAFDFLASRFKLDKTSRVLDLGCGTGNASLPLAPIVGEIVAMDPDQEMILVGQELANENGIRNVKWLNAGSRDLSPELGSFRLVCMGQSFHWMDRAQVLADLYPMVEDKGGIALLGPAHGFVLVGDGPPQPRESWQDAADAVRNAYGVAHIRHARSNPDEPRHEQAVLRSNFQIGEYHEFEFEKSYKPEDILGLLYSMSVNLRERLGARLADFERDMTEALRAAQPAGQFHEHLRTGVLIAIKRRAT